MNYKLEAEQINWATSEKQLFQQTDLSRDAHSPYLNSLVIWVTYASLLLFPLTFGGVHAKTKLGFSFLLLASTSYLLISRKGRAVLQLAINRPYAKMFLAIVLLYIGFSALQNILLGFSVFAHPVLGQISMRNDWLQFALSLQPLIVFSATVVLWFSIFCSGKRVEAVWRLLLLSGALIAAIALSHWFYDNGRLFWLFEPQNVFISERARWPFVNPNHLAAFLLPLVFLAFTQISLRAKEVSEKISAVHGQGIGLLLLSSRVQKSILRLSWDFALLLTIALGLVGALSRSSWLGISAGLLLFIFGRSLISTRPSSIHKINDKPEGQENEPSNVHWLNKLKTRRTKRRSQHKPLHSKFLDFLIKHSDKLYTGFVLFALAGTLFFFLNQQGSELLAGRVEFALASSLDDARWIIFSDSFRILKDHMLLGVGQGSWAQLYPSYASPALAGIDPVYLHSDPYQLLIESGVLGFSLVAAFFVLIFRANFRQIGSSELTKENRLRILGLSSGVFALLTASVFDFPLHIPAIFLLLAALLAFNLYLLDSSKLR